MKKIFIAALAALFVITVSGELFAQQKAQAGKKDGNNRVTGTYDWFGGWGQDRPKNPDAGKFENKNRVTGIYDWFGGWGKYGAQKSGK